MARPYPLRILTALSIVLLATASTPARASDPDRDRDGSEFTSPGSAETNVAPAGESAEDPDRETPPQRATLADLAARAAAARAPERGGLRLNGLGAGGLDWTFLGPRPMTGEYWSGNTNVGGRVSSIAPDPTNPSIVYVAAAQGGVWKTTDAGVNWTVLTDGLTSISSGALAIDPANPNTIWYGTGEQNYCGDCFYGDGLYKSTDAGASWTKVAPVSQVGAYITRIVLQTGSSSTLFAASSRGFIRSTDSGVSWTVTLNPDWCDDVVVDGANPSNVWCAIYGHGVYKSTDAGVNWTLTLAGPGRTNLAIAKTSSRVLYANESTDPGYLYGAFRSNDGGSTWTQLVATPDCLNGQGWYDNVAIVSPTDSNTVLFGGVYPYNGSYHGVIKSTNAGASWTDVTFGVVAGNQVHPDQHAFAFGPDGTLWLGNDGGVWKTADLGQHWVNCNDKLAIAQFYTVATHPTNPNDIIGGTQDNGSVRYTGSVAWPEVVSGDGGPVMYQRESPNIFYTTYVRMDPVYKWNNGSYLGEITGGWSGVDNADWANGPLVEDPTVNGLFYVGTYRMWKSSNSGVSWAVTSSDLTGGSGVLRSTAISAVNSNCLWVGSSDGLVSRSRDAGASWSPAFPGVGNAAIPDIVLSPGDTAAAYLCASLSSGPRVLHTSDGGASFLSVTGDLPAGVRAMSLAVDWRPTPERLYLGTDYGVYVSLNGGTSWIHATNLLPNVAVYDLAIDLVNSKIVAATHGRGMWRADLDVTGPALALTAPVGGESWPVGASRNITWTATDPSGVASVDLLLSLDGGVSYPNTIASALPNTGSYAWTVSPGFSSTAKLRVVAHDGLAQTSNASSPGNFTLTTSPTGVEDGAVAFTFDPVTPSPGRAPFVLRFGLPSAGPVSLDVYDVGGRRIRSLAAGTFGAGRHTMMWDGHDASGARAGDGVFFVRLRAAGHDQVQRVASMH